VLNPADTVPKDVSIQLPLRTPTSIVSMSSAIHTPTHGSTGALTAPATSGLEPGTGVPQPVGNGQPVSDPIHPTGIRHQRPRIDRNLTVSRHPGHDSDNHP
jgi:hypothetical protein